MRITNLHLIVSFLFLSMCGFFAYNFVVRNSLLPRASLPPVASAPDEAEQQALQERRRADETRIRLEAARRRAEPAFTGARSAVSAAKRDGWDVSKAEATLVAAEDALGRATHAAAVEAAVLLAGRAVQEATLRAVQVEVYVTRRGDNLWNISKRKDVYGRGAGWVKIWRANEKRIPDFDKIHAGMRLTIPRRTEP